MDPIPRIEHGNTEPKPDVTKADVPASPTEVKLSEIRPEREDSSRFTFGIKRKWTVLKNGAGNLIDRIFSSRLIKAIKNIFLSILLFRTPAPPAFEQPLKDEVDIPPLFLPTLEQSTLQSPNLVRRNTEFFDGKEFDISPEQNIESISKNEVILPNLVQPYDESDALLKQLEEDLTELSSLYPEMFRSQAQTEPKPSASVDKLPEQSLPIENVPDTFEKVEPESEPLPIVSERNESNVETDESDVETDESDVETDESDVETDESDVETDESDLNSENFNGFDEYEHSWEVASDDSFDTEESISEAVPLPMQTSIHVLPGKPVGMRNASNACYRIAVLQALSVSEPFMQKLSSEPKMRLGEGEIEFFLRSEVLIALKNLLEQKNADEDPDLVRLADEHFRDLLFENNISTEFVEGEEGRQQDAGAFVQTILNNLLGIELTEQISRTGKYFKNKINKDYPPEALSPVVKIEIGEGVENLQSLINQTFSKKVENQDQKNPWYYTDDTPIHEYESQTKIVGEPPEIFTLQLERFKVKDGKLIKDEAEVTLPRDGVIDLAKAYQSDTPIEYTLKSFVYHIGDSIKNGHYVAFVKQAEKWYYCDDHVVQFVEKSRVEKVQKDAYIYFFERKMA